MTSVIVGAKRIERLGDDDRARIDEASKPAPLHPRWMTIRQAGNRYPKRCERT